MCLAEVDRLIDLVFPKLDGWMTPEKAKRVARMVAELPDSRAPLCVELGVFGGRGVVAMGLAIKLCRRGVGRVDGVDPYTVAAALEGDNARENADWWSRVDYGQVLRKASGAISELGLSGIVELVIERSEDVAGRYAGGSIDVLHQDSNHSEAVSSREVELWAGKVRGGGLWVFDDVNWPTTKRAQGMLSGLGFVRVEDHEAWAVFRAP